MNLSKLTLLFFCMSFWGSLQAMHMSPNRHGAMAARPFLSEHVQVLHEDLTIRIDGSFNTAYFDQTFQIKTAQSGSQIPFLLYTGDILTSLKVFVDGEEVKVQEIDGVRNIKHSPFADFAYQFEQISQPVDSTSLLEIMGVENRQINIWPDQMSYFEADLSEGEHTIRITYSARKAFKGDDWVGTSSFSYSLSPSQYWEGFGSFSLTLDGSEFDQPFTTNLREPESGNLASVAKWSLTSMETEVISIDFTPEIKGTARTLIAIGPFWMAQILGFLLLLTHIFLMYSWKKKYPKYRFSWHWFAGAILAPFLYFVGWELCYEWIEYALGDASTGYRGDGAFLLWLAIIVVPLYMGLTALIDYIMESKVKRRGAEA